MATRHTRLSIKVRSTVRDDGMNLLRFVLIPSPQTRANLLRNRVEKPQNHLRMKPVRTDLHRTHFGPARLNKSTMDR